jgi:hypothetical protein
MSETMNDWSAQVLGKPTIGAATALVLPGWFLVTVAQGDTDETLSI